jgi:hypothetical protein
MIKNTTDFGLQKVYKNGLKSIRNKCNNLELKLRAYVGRLV